MTSEAKPQRTEEEIFQHDLAQIKEHIATATEQGMGLAEWHASRGFFVDYNEGSLWCGSSTASMKRVVEALRGEGYYVQTNYEGAYYGPPMTTDWRAGIQDACEPRK